MIRSVIVLFVSSLTFSVLFGAECAFASLPGYETESATFLSFIVETRHKQTSTKGERVEQTLWQEVFIDVKAGKGVTRVIYGEKQPADFSQPDIVVLLSGDEATQIDHKKKQVLIDLIEQAQQDGSAFLFAGRIHQGVLLETVVQQQTLSPIQTYRTVTVGDPFFSTEINLTLDNHMRITAIEDGERSYQFHWGQLEEVEFDFVDSLRVVYDFGFRRIEISEWVRECKVYSELPNQFFQYEWSNDYLVQDLRKKPAPPLTLSK